VATMKGSYAICYRYDAGIVTVLGRSMDCYDPVIPYQCGGIAEGYPWHIRYEKRVEMHFRVKVCVQSSGCTIMRQPWANVWFYDNNTQSQDWGLA
jgi:hypothetical protein